MKLIFRILKVIIPAVTGALLATGCTSDGFSLGGRYLDSNIRTAVIDTCSVKMTTMIIDSVKTSGNLIGLAGQHTDSRWGKVKATTYVGYDVPAEHKFDYDVYFDSVALVMHLSGTFYGDTTERLDINVYPLKQTFELPDYGAFYSNDSVPYYRTPVGKRSFTPRPFTKYSEFSIIPSPKETNKFLIRINDAIGLDLFNKITTGDPILDSEDDFRDYFPGFAVTAGTNNNSILGLTIGADSIFAVRLYYHYSTWERRTGTIDIPVDAERNFYGITYDRTGTLFEELTTDAEELPTNASGNVGLVQALTATYVKIEVPYLNNLLEMGDYGAIIDARLLLYPLRDSYKDRSQLPASLSMYISDENDVSVDAVQTYSGSALQTGDLNVDDMYKEDTYYSYDITSYLSQQLGAIGINKRNLQLICPQDSISKTLNTMVFGDKEYEKDKTRLIITYLIYENE